MKPQRILVAIANPASRRSLPTEKAAAIARRSGAGITLFHSFYSPYVAGERFYDPAALEKDIAAAVEVRKAQLERLAAPLRAEGIEVFIRVRWDYPVHESLVREVLREKSDLVVSESHRHGRLARVMLTNTDWQLIRLCPCPVLFVKNDRPHDKLKVLAAVDPLHAHAKPASLDERLLAEAADYAALFKGQLHVAHIHPRVTPMATGGIMEPVALPVDLAQRHLLETRKAFDALLRPHGVGPRRRHLQPGLPALDLPVLAGEMEAGLVVMGAVSRSGLKRLFIGNTAERVIDQLACDVLVIKPTSFRTPVPRQGGKRPVVLPPL
ncbi:MAG: universal stress protein [Steroidobacteraceae bacterium]